MSVKPRYLSPNMENPPIPLVERPYSRKQRRLRTMSPDPTQPRIFSYAPLNAPIWLPFAAVAVAAITGLTGLLGISGIAFGDANGDGMLDILSNGAAGAYLFFFKGNGNGTFVSGVQSSTSSSAVSNSALGIVAEDFNGDGKLDAYILVTAASGGVRPMSGKGDGSFTAGAVVTTGASPGLNAIATADMDADGYVDLILTNKGSGTVTVVPNGL